jgi:DNA-directed RNA polymerase beta' subunit
MSLAQVLVISSGEVKGSGLYNRRTGLPYEGGLFSQRIFGPIEPNRCRCKALIGRRFIGRTCDRCGVLIGDPCERTKRFGHIVLPAPMVHPLAIGPLAKLLAVNADLLHDVIYGTAWMRLQPANDGMLICNITLDDDGLPIRTNKPVVNNRKSRRQTKEAPVSHQRWIIEFSTRPFSDIVARSSLAVTAICEQINWHLCKGETKRRRVGIPMFMGDVQ